MPTNSSESDPLRVEFKLTESDYLQFQRYIYFHQLRRTKPITYVFLAIVILLDAWVYIGQGWLQALKTISPLIGVYGALYLWRLYQVKRSFRAFSKTSHAACITISPEGVIWTTDGDSANFKWSGVTAIDQNAALVLFLTSNINGMYVPKTAFSSQERCAAFVQAAMGMRKSGTGKIPLPVKIPSDALAGIVFQPTLDDLTRLYRIAQRRTATGRRARIFRLILPLIVFIMVAAPEINQIVRDHDLTTLYPALLGALIIAVVIQIFAHPGVRARRIYNREGMNQTQSITVFKTGFNYSTVRWNSELKWSGVTDIVYEPNGRTVIIASETVAYGIPPSAFTSLEDAQKFHRLVVKLWKGEEVPESPEEAQSTESVWPPSPSQIR